MRQVVLDTETTGLSHEQGHKVIEIGCVELQDRRLTNRHFHCYLNPNRLVDEGAFRVHGISNEFLQDKPFFSDLESQLIEFIDGAELIIHNAPFDIGFLNAEFKQNRSSFKISERCTVFDTLVFAKEKHPGQRNNLDALCKRYDIDNSNRSFHGALLDAEILASVYLAMTGGQGNLFEETAELIANSQIAIDLPAKHLVANTAVLLADENELKRHEEFLQFLVKKSGVKLWETETE